MKDLVAPLIAGWERGDFRPRPELLADDLVLTGFTASGNDVARGPGEIEAYLREFFAEWRDYRISVERLTELDDNQILIEGRQHGIGRSSGMVIDETLFVIVTARDGRVSGIHWHARRDGAFAAAARFSEDLPSA